MKKIPTLWESNPKMAQKCLACATSITWWRLEESPAGGSRPAPPSLPCPVQSLQPVGRCAWLRQAGFELSSLFIGTVGVGREHQTERVTKRTFAVIRVSGKDGHLRLQNAGDRTQCRQHLVTSREVATGLGHSLPDCQLIQRTIPFIFPQVAKSGPG